MSSTQPPPYAPPGPHAGAVPPAVRRAYRDSTAPVIGGVAAGLARHLGIALLWVRVFFVATALLSGLGIALYAGLWMFLPSDRVLDDGPPGLASATRGGRRPGTRRVMADAGPAIALGALMFGVVLMASSILGAGILFWPVVLGVVGIALLWRQADEAQRERLLDSSGRIDPVRAIFGSGGWASYGRVAAGVGLVVTALAVFALTMGPMGSVGPVLAATLLGIAGLGLVVGPWVVRLISDLGSEREARVRSEERADVAAHLHDSVLQTLALIQKNAHDATKVAQLARAQERDLRSWLFESDAAEGATVASVLKATAARVEEDYPVSVDVVTVGDAPYGEAVRPICDAAREAVVNAAKHAGVSRVDVYAEAGAEAIEIFVRDRGVGFDVDAVASDRQGVRGSIVDRMQRHGGTAEVRSVPGQGTEVRLRMPLETQEDDRG